MKPILYVMCGIPASGKSTFAKTYLNNCEYISRDAIRFSMLTDNDKYFAKEKIVFIQFVQNIKNSLINKKDTIADATHISSASRYKLIHAIDDIDYDLIFIVMNTQYKTCMLRNAKRNIKIRVPDKDMINMYNRFTYPNINDFKNCIGVWIINGN